MSENRFLTVQKYPFAGFKTSEELIAAYENKPDDHEIGCQQVALLAFAAGEKAQQEKTVKEIQDCKKRLGIVDEKLSHVEQALSEARKEGAMELAEWSKQRCLEHYPFNTHDHCPECWQSKLAELK